MTLLGKWAGRPQIGRKDLQNIDDKQLVSKIHKDAREGVWGLGEKCVVIKMYKLAATNSQGAIKYSIGNIVNSIVITMYGGRWLLEIAGVGTLCKVHKWQIKKF